MWDCSTMSPSAVITAPRKFVRQARAANGGTVTTILDRYQESSRRRRRKAERANHRLDLQGLRMVAVLAIIANHLWNWPRGGFVGVDIFFVVTGFLVTASLLRAPEVNAPVSFRRFYSARLRRIVPAAAIVLLLTYGASVLALSADRAHGVGVDALLALALASNWWQAISGVDPFAAADVASPVQHFWAISIEQQFYLLWPILLLAVGALTIRRAHGQRLRTAGLAIGAVTAASLGWAVYENTASPTWAYLSTFTRLWEFGVGALLAVVGGALARLPELLRPLLSWVGLGLITTSFVLAQPVSSGFAVPWALLPTAGATLVIVAGIGGEPRWQGFLRNRVSTYIGNLSYSLYLAHWPAIVLIGSLMTHSVYYYVCVLSVSFGLAMALHHLVENPLRDADAAKMRETRRAIEEGVYSFERSSKAGVVAALVLLTVGLIAYAARPNAYELTTPAPTEQVTSVPAP